MRALRSSIRSIYGWLIIVPVLAGAIPATAQEQVPVDVPVSSISLTFDDGPLYSTWHLIDLFEKEKIPATVFLVGDRVVNTLFGKFMFAYYRNNPLIDIANHSFYHAKGKYRLFYSKPDEVVSDILRNEDTLELQDRIVRLPGRNAWNTGERQRYDLEDARPAATTLAGKGYHIMGWDIEWIYDAENKCAASASEMLHQLKRLETSRNLFTPGHIVMLLHDSMLRDETIREQIRIFIEAVKATGRWNFRTARDYPFTCTENPMAANR